ncbi:GNAT family N-acetyltransferase [Actinomadura algeriensis]|uniref:Acetyltransferase n=1 Tax=Actinomadura algeriensis TaxID=1679523 RepID=A0ABR9K4K1_9ACTN|nr:GNAT family N-acetyltransferase [Actinomadura algeriensis]MBE1537769.1 putative acetyltransferase [Actinomadura algeriensis]
MIELRNVPADDVDRMIDLAATVFHFRITDRDRMRDWVSRMERIGAYGIGGPGEDDLAGQMGVAAQRLSVPGGELDCSAVTFVGVLPTYRRRGILSSLIDRMHADAAAAGRPVAALWASEGPIYGRYGFGVADRRTGFKVDTSRPFGLRTVPDDRPLRLLDRERVPDVLGPMYARESARRPGGLARDEWWWLNRLVPHRDERSPEYGEPRVVVHPEGYAIYRTQGRTVRLYDMAAETPRVEAAFWTYLASIDLTHEIVAPERPVDDLVTRMAADPDQVTVTGDSAALWLRLVDVPAALRGRSWAADDTFVLDVADARIPGNRGRWRLTTGAAPGCERTGDAPDLALDVADLAAVYLGGTPVRTLVRVGTVDEHTPGAADRLDAALAVPLAPYTNDNF